VRLLVIADTTPCLGMGFADYVATHDIVAVVTAGDLTRFDLAGIDRVPVPVPGRVRKPLRQQVPQGSGYQESASEKNSCRCSVVHRFVGLRPLQTRHSRCAVHPAAIQMAD